MRPVAISVLLLAALAGLAVVPMAAAAPPTQPCNGTIGGGPTIGPVTVFVSPPCYEVEVHTMSCPVSPETHREVRVGTVAVRVYSCAAVEAASAPPCTCPPPPRCNPITTVGPLAEIVSVTVTSSCRVVVEVLPRLVACSDPLDGRKSVSVGQLTVTLPCGQVDQCEIECYPMSASTPKYLPVCIEREVQQGAVRAGYSTCYDEFVEVVDCGSGGAQRIRYANDLGPAYVRVDYCLPHSPPPSAAASNPGPCGTATSGYKCPAPVPLCSGVKDPIEGPVDVDISSTCRVLVTVDAMDCVQEGRPITYTAGPATVSAETCSAPTSATAVEAPPCTCPPPQPLCQPVTRALADNQYYSISDSCDVTVTLEAYCGLQGTEQHQLKASKLTVNYQTCQAPPQQAAMADPFPTCVRECSPLPSEACELRDATPSPLLHPLWGYDCTLDVHTACTGGASGSKDARIGFVDVSIAQCSGPDWS